MVKGKVYLVGAGPGDPNLITVKALKVLKEADVVAYDRLLPRNIVKEISADVEKIYVGKSSGDHSVPQDEIGKILVEKAKQGKKVVRLKGGDPFMFGRGGEEAEDLKNAGIDFEIINGVTSAIAGPSYAGIPVTHRKYASSVAIVTGHEDPQKEGASVDWEKLGTAVDTIVILMGVAMIKSITSAIIRGGRDPNTPAAAIEWATTEKQRTVKGTLEDLAEKIEEENVKPPSIIVIGDVVNLKDKLSWFEGGSENV